MPAFRSFFLALTALLYIPAMGQLQVDHPIQLTGSGTNAKLSGIQSVTGSQDATSVQYLQNGSFIYGTTTGSGNAYNLSLNPATLAYQAGMVFNFIANQTNTGASTLNVDGHGAVPLVKNINQAFTGCEIQTGQAVTVLYDGTNFQMLSVSSTGGLPTADAGPSQTSVSGTSTYLAGNTPSSGSGIWAIVSGTGGSIASPTNPNSLFTGTPGSSYVLSWTVTSTCGSASSDVNISFAQQPHGSQIFSSPSTANPFTVASGVYSITIACYGAQGSSGYATGGMGGYAEGTLSVTPGLELYVSVGGQSGTNGGGTGGHGNNGGGMSDVRRGSTNFDSVLIVAGGGGAGGGIAGQYGGYIGGTGGGAATTCTNAVPGGGGGGVVGNAYESPGSDGTCTSGGAAGSSSGGGSGGGGGGGLTSGGSGSSGGGYGSSGTDGSFGQGGSHGSTSCNTGTGGGGGYYGGGGTSDADCGGGGGGGGSSWASSELTSLTFEGGIQSGNGQVVISW